MRRTCNARFGLGGAMFATFFKEIRVCKGIFFFYFDVTVKILMSVKPYQ